jgi:hypothetical protein
MEKGSRGDSLTTKMQNWKMEKEEVEKVEELESGK